jgi:hypothetical protein
MNRASCAGDLHDASGITFCYLAQQFVSKVAARQLSRTHFINRRERKLALFGKNASHAY